MELLKLESISATICRHKFSLPETRSPREITVETKFLSETAATISTGSDNVVPIHWYIMTDQFTYGPTKGAARYRQVKVLEFFDYPGPRQGVEDLRELLHKGAQGDREVKVFQVSNDDTAVSEVAKHLGVAGTQQQNGLVDETNVTLFANVRCFLIESGLSKVFWVEDTTMSTYLVNRSSSSAIGFKKPIDMNMGFNESGEYKKTFIGSGVGMGSMQVLHGFEFKVKPLGDHTFEVEPQENIDQRAGLQEVQTQDLIDCQLAHDREQHLACELFGYRENSNEAAFVVAAVEKIYAHESLTFNNTVSCEVISKWKAGLKMIWMLGQMCMCSATVTGNAVTTAMAITGSRFYNEKLVHTLLEGHSILPLEGSLSRDCDVKKNGKWSCIYAVGSQEYQMVCTRPDIASTDVGMLDGFDRRLQTYVQVFVDFDYAMGRSITGYGFMILGREGSYLAKGTLGSKDS
uniref:Zinc finger, CCHC-type n=1 Tax=Tanacetum cinerariifolium TaxID=118510 RepID=A0A6L2K306_TANCI|nr:zinc finger, CCHC-type [Tanacetum cinerariifolium]